MNASKYIINKINSSGTGYTISEVNTHDHYSIYEFTVYFNHKAMEKSTRISILDAIKDASEAVHHALGIRSL